ncbi:ATP-binding protein [Lentzea flava]|uniref:ATPase n=1 Tax=Lentzea flava TaxID=103732 RepID=A0ABQ2VF36_9PSEU|nr:ATP-binding protein [Lentzea flava]MCP2204806.1 Anti-sigma regulatory factor (Ser/Thr protein kinase) [Lentzea flava]GGU81136.1 ATPase [Lentzea flava]
MTDNGSDPLPRSQVFSLEPQVPTLVRVRRWAAQELADLSDDELGDVLLVVTELITNAFDHGQMPAQVRLQRSTQPCFVRIEDEDASPDRPTLGRSRLSDTRGRGLIIVDRLAKDWGVISHPVGKTVWAEITCETP